MERKVVQTELSTEEYERLRRVVNREGRSLKDVLRDAAIEYTQTHFELEPDDPLFNYDPEDSVDESVSATNTDDFLYGGE